VASPGILPVNLWRRNFNIRILNRSIVETGSHPAETGFEVKSCRQLADIELESGSQCCEKTVDRAVCERLRKAIGLAIAIFYNYIGARLGIAGPTIPPLANLIRAGPA
jgi:hypothetical protein